MLRGCWKDKSVKFFLFVLLFLAINTAFICWMYFIEFIMAVGAIAFESGSTCFWVKSYPIFNDKFISTNGLSVKYNKRLVYLLSAPFVMAIILCCISKILENLFNVFIQSKSRCFRTKIETDQIIFAFFKRIGFELMFVLGFQLIFQ